MKIIFERGRILILASALVLAGTGCDLGGAIGLRNPFTLGGRLESQPSYALSVGQGARFTVRPSALGVGGTISELLGRDEGSRAVTVDAFGPEAVAISWRALASATGTPISGTIASTGWASGHAMLPPAFWQAGDARTEGNGLLWLSPAAYAELTGQGATEWRAALPIEGVSPLAAKALSAFESLAAKLATQGSATATSPFRMTKGADIGSYPVRVNGAIEHVRAFRASGWLMDMIVLENPDTPLILNVTVNPAGVAALSALKPLNADASSFGYEVTDIVAK